MSIIDTLITDRTERDAILAASLNTKGFPAMTAEERAFYLSAANKGSYKALDMNRVEEAVQYVADRLNANGTSVTVSNRRWTDADVPTPAEFEAYRQNIIALRSALAVLPGTPDVPGDIPSMTVREANDLESILRSIDRALDNIAAAWYYSGEIYTGEV